MTIQVCSDHTLFYHWYDSAIVHLLEDYTVLSSTKNKGYKGTKIRGTRVHSTKNRGRGVQSNGFCATDLNGSV